MNRWHADGPRNHNVGFFEKIQSLMRDLQCEPEHSKDRIIFMSMCNDIERCSEGNSERCAFNSQTVAEYTRRFSRDHWSFVELKTEKKWHGTFTDKHDGFSDRMAAEIMLNFSGSDHPIFRASGASERKNLRRNRGGKKSTYTLQL